MSSASDLRPRASRQQQHQSAFADGEQDLPGVEPVLFGSRFGVTQEARVHAGVAEGEGFPVDLHRTVLQGSDDVVGGVLEGEQVAIVLPAVQVGDGNERFDRAVAGTGAVPGEGGVDPGDALFDRHNGVGDRQRQVLVGVDADLGLGVEDVAVGADPLADTVHREPAAGVGDVHAVRAVGLHQFGLLRQLLRFGEMGHHQETGDVHAEFAGGADVLGGDVGLGEIGRASCRERVL